MNHNRTGGPAFPVIGAPGADEDYPGMTLRDYFAGQALVSLIAKLGHPEAAAERAYAHADAMIAAREK